MNYIPDYETVARKVGHMHLCLNEKQMTILVNACAKAFHEENDKSKAANVPEPLQKTHAHNAELFMSMWKMLEQKHNAWMQEYSVVQERMIREEKKFQAKRRAQKAAITRMLNKQANKSA